MPRLMNEMQKFLDLFSPKGTADFTGWEYQVEDSYIDKTFNSASLVYRRTQGISKVELALRFASGFNALTYKILANSEREERESVSFRESVLDDFYIATMEVKEVAESYLKYNGNVTQADPSGITYRQYAKNKFIENYDVGGSFVTPLGWVKLPLMEDEELLHAGLVHEVKPGFYATLFIAYDYSNYTVQLNVFVKKVLFREEENEYVEYCSQRKLQNLMKIADIDLKSQVKVGKV